MTAHNLDLCELRPWDTEFFGCRVAQVRGDTLNEEQARQIEGWSRNHGIRCLYFLSRANDPATIQTAEKHGFGLVDIRITLEYAPVNSHPPAVPDPPAGIRVRPAQPGDLPELQLMARTAHTDTRFFKDSRFPRERAEELYSTWITKDTQGRAQLVLVAAAETGQPLGYLTCHLDSTSRQGQIGLVAVSSLARRRGIGKLMVLNAVDWFRTQGAGTVLVVTQGENLAAQRLYQQCGFLSQNLQIWYHKWYPISD